MKPPESGTPIEAFTFGVFRADVARHELLRDGQPVAITTKAWDTLLLLLKSRGRVVEKDEILTAVWPDAFVSEDSLTQAISVLRKAMGDDSAHPRYIATVPRRGYRFVADVTVEPVEAGAGADEHQRLATEGVADPGPLRSPATAPSADPAAVAQPTRDRGNWWRFWWAIPAVVLIGLVARTVSVAPRGGQTGAPIQFLQNAPDGTTLASGGILSPDGRYLTFIAQDNETGSTYLWLRALDAPAATLLAGTDGAYRPFWSPDSRSIGFFAEGRLKRIGISGEPPRTLSSVGYRPSGGSWSPRGVIVYADRLSQMYRVPEEGGAPVPITTLDTSLGEIGHQAPQFLPDGTHFLFFAQTAERTNSATYIGSLDSSDRIRLLDGSASGAVFAPPGYLLYVRDSVLMAQRFDPDALRLTGVASTVPSVNAAREDGESRVGELSASANGLLTFGGDRAENRLTWFSREGVELERISAPANLHNPVISPDGRFLLAEGAQAGGIWIVDLVRGAPTRLVDYGNLASWSHNGREVSFTSRRVPGTSEIALRAVAGSTDDERVLVRSQEMKISGNWTSDGQHFTYATSNPKTRLDVWTMTSAEDAAPRPFLNTSANEMQPQVSPDGHWLAYASDETGTWEVYVQAFPSGGQKRIVSVGGGAQPEWRRDGRELYYLSPDGTLMAVGVRTGASFEVGRPAPLFRAPIASDIIGYRNQYAASADGERFVIDLLGERDPIHVVVNWNALVNP